jgi:hypothetical protein
MDVHINENPEVGEGDLIFVDDMMRGRQYMVVALNLTKIVDDSGKKVSYRYGLVDLAWGKLIAMFETSSHLQRQVDNWMCSVHKSRDYTMNLRRK